MGEIVNLRLSRKRAARRAGDAAAAGNRIAHGLPKAVKDAARREAASSSRRLDGHRLDPAAPGSSRDTDPGGTA